VWGLLWGSLGRCSFGKSLTASARCSRRGGGVVHHIRGNDDRTGDWDGMGCYKRDGGGRHRLLAFFFGRRKMGDIQGARMSFKAHFSSACLGFCCKSHMGRSHCIG
jgi:hypothetical protein